MVHPPGNHDVHGLSSLQRAGPRRIQKLFRRPTQHQEQTEHGVHAPLCTDPKSGDSEPSRLENTLHTSESTQRNTEPIMKTGFEYWLCNRPSIQDATPEERSTASLAVGRGAGLFVALGTSTCFCGEANVRRKPTVGSLDTRAVGFLPSIASCIAPIYRSLSILASRSM